MKRLQILVVLVLLLSSVKSVKAQDENPLAISSENEKEFNITDFIAASKEHTILLESLRITGVLKILNEVGPFTIFAPTNTAFEKLSKETLEDLMHPNNTEKLKSILLYHIIKASVNTSDLSKAISENNDEAIYKTLNGDLLVIYKQRGILTLEDSRGNDSLIEIPDKKLNNGYVHIVDTVILPN